MLSAQLKAYRQKHGMTQNDLADVLNVSRTAVSRWEAGYGIPDVGNLQALAAVLGTTVDDLLSEGEQTRNADDAKGEKRKKRLLAIAAAFAMSIILLTAAFIRQRSRSLARVLHTDYSEASWAEYPFSSFKELASGLSEFEKLLKEMGRAKLFSGTDRNSTTHECRQLFSVRLDDYRYDVVEMRGEWYVIDVRRNTYYSCGSGLIDAGDAVAYAEDPDHISYFLGPLDYVDNTDGKVYPINVFVRTEKGVPELRYRITGYTDGTSRVIGRGIVSDPDSGMLRNGTTYHIPDLTSENWPALNGFRLDYLLFTFYDAGNRGTIVGEEKVAVCFLDETPLNFVCDADGGKINVYLSEKEDRRKSRGRTRPSGGSPSSAV